MDHEGDDKQEERPVRSSGEGCYYCGTDKTCEQCTWLVLQRHKDAAKEGDWSNLLHAMDEVYAQALQVRILGDVEADLSSRKAYEERQDIVLAKLKGSLKAPPEVRPPLIPSPPPSPLPSRANPGVGVDEQALQPLARTSLT